MLARFKDEQKDIRIVFILEVIRFCCWYGILLIV
jgi:hypothetical protein